MASDGTIKIDTELDSSKAKSALSEFSSLGKTALNGVKTGRDGGIFCQSRL